MSSFGGGFSSGGPLGASNTNPSSANVSGSTITQNLSGAKLTSGTTNAANTTQGSGSLFVNPLGSAPASGVGGSTTTGTTTAPGNLFGTGSTGAGIAPPSSSLFGTGSTSNNLFGTSPTASGSTPATGNSFGGGSAPTPSNTLFGNNIASSGATTTNSLFGGNSAFSLPKPNDQSTAPKPPVSSFFSQPNASSTGSLGASPFVLSSKPTEATSAATTDKATTNNASTGSLFGGGGSLFAKPGGPSSTTTAPAIISSPFSLGGNKESSTPSAGGLFNTLSGSTTGTEKKDGLSTAAPGTTPLNLFGVAKTNEKKDATTEKPKDSATSSIITPTSTTNTTVAIPPPSMLRGKSLEEIVNKWTSELDLHAREFSKFAGEVAVWDRALIENGNNLANLYSHVEAAERQQNEIDQSLSHVEQQQKDLANTLDAYERVAQEILGGQGGGLRTLDTGPADTERDKNYMLATDLHAHLDDLSGSLTQMIDAVNSFSISSKPVGESGDDPMAQIAQILSSHLESLQWIDGAVREVESKVTDVEKRVQESGHSLSISSVAGSKSRQINR